MIIGDNSFLFGQVRGGLPWKLGLKMAKLDLWHTWKQLVGHDCDNLKLLTHSEKER